MLTLAVSWEIALPCRGTAAPLIVPIVDRLELMVLVDSTTAVFGTAIDTAMIKVTPPPITRDYHQAFAGQWGYSVLARSAVGAVARTTLIDFGYTPTTLLGNMALLGVDAAAIDAMVGQGGVEQRAQPRPL